GDVLMFYKDDIRKLDGGSIKDKFAFGVACGLGDFLHAVAHTLERDFVVGRGPVRGSVVHRAVDRGCRSGKRTSQNQGENKRDVLQEMGFLQAWMAASL